MREPNGKRKRSQENPRENVSVRLEQWLATRQGIAALKRAIVSLKLLPPPLSPAVTTRTYRERPSAAIVRAGPSLGLLLSPPVTPAVTASTYEQRAVSGHVHARRQASSGLDPRNERAKADNKVTTPERPFERPETNLSNKPRVGGSPMQVQLRGEALHGGGKGGPPSLHGGRDDVWARNGRNIRVCTGDALLLCRNAPLPSRDYHGSIPGPENNPRAC